MRSSSRLQCNPQGRGRQIALMQRRLNEELFILDLQPRGPMAQSHEPVRDRRGDVAAIAKVLTRHAAAFPRIRRRSRADLHTDTTRRMFQADGLRRRLLCVHTRGARDRHGGRHEPRPISTICIFTQPGRPSCANRHPPWQTREAGRQGARSGRHQSAAGGATGQRSHS